MDLNHPDQPKEEGWAAWLNTMRAKLQLWLTKTPQTTTQIDLQRRRILMALGSTLFVAAIGLPACTKEKEQTPPPKPEVAKDANKISFFGTEIEIEDKEKFQALYNEALQLLVLKFSKTKETETNEAYWHRAIEHDFCHVLEEMDRYEGLVNHYAQELGIHEDAVSYFGVEAGFNTLRRSPTGFCGLGQIGLDAVQDVREKSDVDLKIPEEKMNPWFDLRFDQSYGIANGVAYLKIIRDAFPETVQKLFKTFQDNIKEWLEQKIDGNTTRLEKIEKKLGLKPNTKFNTTHKRYKRILKTVLPEEHITIADPESFAIHAYNMGALGVAKLIFINFVEAKAKGKNLTKDHRISVFKLDPKANDDDTTEDSKDDEDTDDNTIVSGFDFDMGQELSRKDKESARKERATYLWQAFVFKDLATKWRATPPGGVMEIQFPGNQLNGLKFTLKKPAQKPIEFKKEIETETVELEIPAGLDLVKLANHLELDEQKTDEKQNHHEAFRRHGNAAFVRAGAYYGDPTEKKYSNGNIKIRIPKTKEEKAKKYIKTEPAKVAIYKVKKGDTGTRILAQIAAKYNSLPEEQRSHERVFWIYNRMNRASAAKIKTGDIIALPAELAL